MSSSSSSSSRAGPRAGGRAARRTGGRRAASVADALGRTTRLVDGGRGYEAAELCRTLASRHALHTGGERGAAEAAEIISRTARLLLADGRTGEGVGLGLYLVKFLRERRCAASPRLVGEVLAVFSACPEDVQSETLLTDCIKWMEGAPEPVPGSPEAEERSTLVKQCYLLLAQNQAGCGEFLEAQSSFLHTDNVTSFAEMLAEWASEAPEAERDLVLARALLHSLAGGNLRQAKGVHAEFVARVREDILPRSPLMNYLVFLLSTLERPDAYPLFVELRTAYQPSLDRDPSFARLVDRVAEVFFNVRPQPQAGGGLGGMLASLMGGLSSLPQ